MLWVALSAPLDNSDTEGISDIVLVSSVILFLTGKQLVLRSSKVTKSATGEVFSVG